MKSIIKKFKITSGLFVLSTLLFAGCAMGGDLDSSSGTSGSSGSSGTKHQWTTDSIEVTPNKAYYAYLDQILLAGDYTKDDFVVNERDSEYMSYTFADWAGYGDRYNANVINQTTITVNGVEKPDGEFTIEPLKDYTIKFTYNNFSQTLTVKGAKKGSIVAASEDTKEIHGVTYGDVYDGKTILFKTVELSESALAGDSLYTSSVKIKDVTSANGYTIFEGDSESNLTKSTISSLSAYTFYENIKIIKIYHEDIDSPSQATTAAYTINVTATKVSDIKNMKASFNDVTANTTISLLDILKNDPVLTAYTTKDDVSTKCGQMRIADKQDDGSFKVRVPFTLEIYATAELTGDPLQTITTSTTSADKWNVGTGVDFPTYKTSSYNGVTTYTPSSPGKKAYYVKIIYNEGGTNISSSNEEKIHEGTSYKYYPMASVILVNFN